MLSNFNSYETPGDQSNHGSKPIAAQQKYASGQPYYEPPHDVKHSTPNYTLNLKERPIANPFPVGTLGQTPSRFPLSVESNILHMLAQHYMSLARTSLAEYDIAVCSSATTSQESPLVKVEQWSRLALATLEIASRRQDVQTRPDILIANRVQAAQFCSEMFSAKDGEEFISLALNIAVGKFTSLCECKELKYESKCFRN
jgi:hypothetical protein